jgi:hypothetical protein
MEEPEDRRKMSARRCDYCGVFEGYQHSANCKRYPSGAMQLSSEARLIEDSYKVIAEAEEEGRLPPVGAKTVLRDQRNEEDQYHAAHLKGRYVVVSIPPEVIPYATEIARFIEAMVYKLKVHSKKGKWENQTIESRLPFLEGEVQELREAIATGNMVEITLEAADVANYALIIAAKGMER